MVLGSHCKIFSFDSENVRPPIFLKPEKSSETENKLKENGEFDYRQSSANSNPETSKEPLTPESGDIGDIGDTNNTPLSLKSGGIRGMDKIQAELKRIESYTICHMCKHYVQLECSLNPGLVIIPTAKTCLRFERREEI